MNSDQVALVGQVFESYISEYHKNDILLILKERDEDAHYPVVVNAMTLFETNMEIGEYFNTFPNEVLTVFDSALRRSALTILQSLSQPEGASMKQNLHARISGDDLTIYGVVMQRWKPFQQDVRCEVEIVLKANYVQVNNEQSTGII
uniref:MCM9 N-terminal domain-containing protein n=1 Tax=Felis catus TaxID=9685 RepID=A0ABI7XN79_FELCA